MNNSIESSTNTLIGSNRSSQQFENPDFVSITTITAIPNLRCTKCSDPECKGQSPKDTPCDRYQHR